MSGPSELAMAVGSLVDAGIKATLLLPLGWAVTRLVARSAAQRHAVWTVTFAGLPVLLGVAAWSGSQIAIDQPWWAAVWAIGAMGSLAPFLRGLVGLRSLRVRATADPVEPDVVWSDQVASPLTWGVFRPVIVLPTAAARWTAADRRAALAHERAHVRRRDWAVHAFVRSVGALFWFHPFVWWAQASLAREAEHAADDLVLASGVVPSDYASLLVSLARAPSSPAALGAGSSAVGRRVQAVLSDRRRSARRWPVGLVALSVVSLVVSGLGPWRPWTPPVAPVTCQPGPHP